MLLPKRTRETGLPAKFLISIVDDDESFRESLASLMRSLGFRVEAFICASDLLASPHLRHTCCLIADINMPCMTGVELYDHLVKAGYAIPTILITAYPDDRIRTRAMADGVICYLSKPFAEATLLGCVHAALKRVKPDRHQP